MEPKFSAIEAVAAGLMHPTAARVLVTLASDQAELRMRAVALGYNEDVADLAWEAASAAATQRPDADHQWMVTRATEILRLLI